MGESCGHLHVGIDPELPTIDERLVFEAFHSLFGLVIGLDLVALPIRDVNAVAIDVDVAVDDEHEMVTDSRVGVFVYVPHAGVVDRVQVRRLDRAGAAEVADQVVGVESDLVTVGVQGAGRQHDELGGIGRRQVLDGWREVRRRRAATTTRAAADERQKRSSRRQPNDRTHCESPRVRKTWPERSRPVRRYRSGCTRPP